MKLLRENVTKLKVQSACVAEVVCLNSGVYLQTTAMPPLHQRSGGRIKWSDEQLQAPLEAVNVGKLKSHAAAVHFGIPSSILHDQLKGEEPEAI